MMRRWAFAVAVVLASSVQSAAWAQWFGAAEAVVSPTAVSSTAPAGAQTNSKAARVVWLDKQTNRRETLVLNVGTVQPVAGLQLELKRCVMDMGGVLGRDAAWLEVAEPKSLFGAGRATPWFAGWMQNQFPEVATLDHPRYDMILLGCGEQPRRKVTKVAKKAAMETRDVEVQDFESAEPVTPTGDDPYLVPGLDKSLPVTPSAVEAAPAAQVAPPAVPVVLPVPAVEGATPPAEAQPEPVQPAAVVPPAPAAPAANLEGGLY